MSMIRNPAGRPDDDLRRSGGSWVEAGRLAAWREMTAGDLDVREVRWQSFYLNSSRAIFLQTFAGDLL
jgi:hypothetical protein